MRRIQWPEVNDVEPHINLMVAFDSGRGMRAWGACISLGAAKTLYSELGADALKDHASVEALQWLSTQLGTSLIKLELPVAGILTTLHGFFLGGCANDLSAYSRHGRFCETAFGDLHRVSLEWLEAGTGEPFSLIFCW